MEDLNAVICKLPKSSVIVYTYGAWDVLHPGHVKLLSRARNLGDFLIVGVVADDPIKKLKGEKRPIQNQNDRLFTVASFRSVNAAISQPLYDPSEVIEGLSRVDILTKGDDWDYIPGEDKIREIGGELVRLTYTHGVSSSKLISKMSNEEKLDN